MDGKALSPEPLLWRANAFGGAIQLTAVDDLLSVHVADDDDDRVFAVGLTVKKAEQLARQVDAWAKKRRRIEAGG